MINGIRDFWRRRIWLRAALQRWREEVDEQPYPEMDHVYVLWLASVDQKEDPPKGAE